MERGSYVAASGGMLEMKRLEVVNNNLANIDTPGFKRELIMGDEESFDQTLASVTAKNDPFAKGDHDRSPGTVNVRSVTDFSPGPIEHTGNPFDLALRHPNDFFAINTANGGTQYTRAGNFTLNSNGELVTSDGQQVQGDGGAIQINDANVSIQPDGRVMANGNQVALVQVVHIDDTSQLRRTGNSRFVLPPGSATPEAVEFPEMVPESLEKANVSAVNGIIDLILTQRGFEMYTQTAQQIDTMNQSAIAQIGRKNS